MVILARLVRVSVILGLTLSLAACRASGASKAPIPPAKVDDSLASAPSQQTAVFAGGCFWGTQAVFERVKGVVKTTVGYAGGSASTATYDQVTTETTGHAESVEVVYDPSKITYGQLLRIFFSVAHDPTQLNRQGTDVGTSYRSAIFYPMTNRNASPPPTSRNSTPRRSFPADRHRSDAAEGLLPCRGLPSGLRAPPPGKSLHPGLRPPQD